MVGGQLWSEDESCVLVAIFMSNDFSIGDDARPENHLMAEAFDRSPAAVDWQWRNIDGLIQTGKAALNVGSNIIQAVGNYEADPRTSRLEAVEVCRRQGWTRLIDLIGIGRVQPPISADGGASFVAVSVDDVPVAAVNAEWAEVQRLTSSSVIYREAQLSERFRSRLLSAGHEVSRFRITRSGTPPLYTDLADTTSQVLYEAKGSSDRMSVRLALGQILDYGRCVENMGLALLLPDEPSPDLIALLREHGIGCVVERRDGAFVDVTGLGRCGLLSS